MSCDDEVSLRTLCQKSMRLKFKVGASFLLERHLCSSQLETFLKPATATHTSETFSGEEAVTDQFNIVTHVPLTHHTTQRTPPPTQDGVQLRPPARRLQLPPTLLQRRARNGTTAWHGRCARLALPLALPRPTASTTVPASAQHAQHQLQRPHHPPRHARWSQTQHTYR